MRTRESTQVAPYVGAWIETLLGYINKNTHTVAPYVGAWIETRTSLRASAHTTVAPYVGAWIETINLTREKQLVVSHPTWVRGLKLSPLAIPLNL